MTNTRKEYFDAAIIIPLEEELQVVQTVFTTLEDRSTAESYRAVVGCAEPKLRVLLVQQELEGRTYAAKALGDILRDYEVGIAICLGIAGCLSSDYRLCDVIYSGEVIDVLDNAKISDVGHGESKQMQIDFSPQRYETLGEYVVCKPRLPEVERV